MLRKPLGLGLALGVSLLLAACSPGEEAPTATPSQAIQVPVTETALPAGETAATQPGPAATDDQPAAEPTEPQELPLGSPSLKASDPTAVSLTAGQPQVVEFFAFW